MIEVLKKFYSNVVLFNVSPIYLFNMISSAMERTKVVGLYLFSEPNVNGENHK